MCVHAYCVCVCMYACMHVCKCLATNGHHLETDCGQDVKEVVLRMGVSQGSPLQCEPYS